MVIFVIFCPLGDVVCIPHAPWCWNIYIYITGSFLGQKGQYSNTMRSASGICNSFQFISDPARNSFRHGPMVNVIFLHNLDVMFMLVGGWATPLKNMKVNWDDDIPNIWENKK